MLNRTKFLAQIKSDEAFLFFDAPAHEPVLVAAWQAFLPQAERLKELIQKRSWSLSLPVWLEDPGCVFDVLSADFPYTILGVDGSQIYPDRHYADLAYFLLNTGGLTLSYEPGCPGQANFFSEPHLLRTETVAEMVAEEQSFSNDLVDLLREEYEFRAAFDRSAAFVHQAADRPFLCLLDGSFIFWHLQGKPAVIKEHFLNRFMFYLHRFSQERIPVAAYVSMPRSKELTNVLRLVLCRKMEEEGVWCGGVQGCSCAALEGVVDLHLMQQLLMPGQRSAVFLSKSAMADEYLLSIRPCFFFMHVGDEIARVEVPHWIAQDRQLLEFTMRAVANQACKGRGYPIALAEAHEQAVIKGADRDYFYQTLSSVRQQQRRMLSISAKSLRKKQIGI